MGSTRNVDLPEEMKQEILLRLPVKSLSRFKCVSKHWCTLIGSPSFVHQQFCHENNQERLLIRLDRPDKKEYAFSLHIDEICSRYEGTDHLRFPTQVTNVIGPLNGVFCVTGYRGAAALLNPAMRQFKPFPLLTTYNPPCIFFSRYLWGLGLDPSSGDYKLVCVRFCWSGRLGNSTLASVCNSSSDSWRNLEDVSLAGIVRGDNPMFSTYLNGRYYWLVETYPCYEFPILAFDMSSEKFQTIQSPQKSKAGSLILWGDSLAFLTPDIVNGGANWIGVWMMKNERCWIKCQMLGPFQGMPRALGIFKKDEMLLETDISSLVLYNLCTRKSKSIECKWMSIGLRERAILYKESLVSVKGEGDKCMLWDTPSEFVKNLMCSP